MEYTKEQLREKFQKLPKDLQQTLLSDDLGIGIQIIGRDTNITPEQALDVEDEAVAILMGTSNPKDFIHNIQSKLNIDQEKARVIAERVNEEIFQPVKESLKTVHNIKDEVAPTTPVTPFVVPTTPASMPPQAPKPPIAPTAPSSFPQMIIPPKINLEIPPRPSTPPQPQLSQNIFEQKLQGVFKMPKEETLVPQKPSSSPTPPTSPRPSGVDPYREPPK
jgi:hypothetical protein